MNRLLPLLLAVVLLGCQRPERPKILPLREPTPTPGPEITLEVPYARIEGTDPALTSLDIYAPLAASNLPVVIFVHGGGWDSGDKRLQGERKAEWLNAAGYVFVSINYRLSPAVVHPAHVQDVARAIAWAQANIANYGGDPARLFLLGHSAGAQLVALVATDERYLAAEGLPLSAIRGVAGLDGGGYDIPSATASKERNADERFDVAFGSDPAVWADASPLTHVGPGKGIPPFLLAYGGNRALSRDQADALAAALQAAGVAAQTYHAEDRNHLTLNRDLGKPDDATSGPNLLSR